MSMEVELKLWFNEALSDDLLARINNCWHQLADSVQSSEPTQLLNAYFETPDQWFRRHDSGLRSRLKKGRFEQTIKLAGQQQGAAHIRPEYNLPCDSVVPVLAAFPAHIWPQDTDVAVLQQQLTEMFRTDFVRRAWLLTLADGTVVEAVLDQGEVKAAAQSQPILELELELCSGNPLQLFQIAEALCQQLPLSLGFQSKAERGYRLAQSEPLRVQQATPEMPLGQQLRLLLQNLWLSGKEPDTTPPDSAILQQQWLLLKSSLAKVAEQKAQPELVSLLQKAPAQAFCGTSMTLWLLQLSALLLDITEVSHG